VKMSPTNVLQHIGDAVESRQEKAMPSAKPQTGSGEGGGKLKETLVCSEHPKRNHSKATLYSRSVEQRHSRKRVTEINLV